MQMKTGCDNFAPKLSSMITTQTTFGFCSLLKQIKTADCTSDSLDTKLRPMEAMGFLHAFFCTSLGHLQAEEV